MEYINCILCEIDDTHLLVKKDFYNVVQCKRCGLVYLNPRLDEEELTKLYNKSLISIDEDIPVNQSATGHDIHNIKKFNIAIRLIKKHKKHIRNIFDLGCSKGIFLDLAFKEGWIPHGSDVNRHLIKKNKKKYGNQVKLQSGNHIEFPDQYFDVVTLFDVAEHLPNPIDTFQEVSRILKVDGFLVLSTPNIEGLFPILTYYSIGKFVGAWEHPTPPGHVFQFSQKTLRKAFDKAGLTLVDFANHEIYPPYTRGKLENSIIDALKKQKVRIPHDYNQETCLNDVKSWEHEIKDTPSFFSFNKMPRLIIRCICFALVTVIYPVARLCKKGDSMVCIAQKKP